MWKQWWKALVGVVESNISSESSIIYHQRDCRPLVNNSVIDIYFLTRVRCAASCVPRPLYLCKQVTDQQSKSGWDKLCKTLSRITQLSQQDLRAVWFASWPLSSRITVLHIIYIAMLVSTVVTVLQSTFAHLPPKLKGSRYMTSPLLSLGCVAFMRVRSIHSFKDAAYNIPVRAGIPSLLSDIYIRYMGLRASSSYSRRFQNRVSPCVQCRVSKSKLTSSTKFKLFVWVKMKCIGG
jgi:hypothetical protein